MIDREDHPALLRLIGAKQIVGVSKNFATIVVCDFEYEVADGDLPNVLCMVAYVLDETSGTYAPSGCGAANLAARRRSTSAPTRCSSPTAPGRK